MSAATVIVLVKGDPVPGWQEPSIRRSTLDVVVRGRVGVFAGARDDHLLYVVDPGGTIATPDTAGEPGGRCAVRALTAAAVARFDRNEVQAAMGREPLLASLFEYLRLDGSRTGQDPTGTVMARVARQLDAFAEGRGSFTLPVTQEELARLVGASRERVNRALHRLVDEGVVAYSGRQFRILARDGLQRAASGGG